MDDIYIEKVKNGDVEAFRYFVRQYQHMAYSVAISVVKDEFLAEEVVQEAFINVYNKLDSFKGNSKFSTWLYRIVINKAFRSLDKQKKLSYESIDDAETVLSDDSFEPLSKDEQSYYINETLQQMPPKESLALRLFYLQEMSMEELQDVTGWSLSNVKVILHRARKRFYTLINALLKTEVNSIL
ncbi:RNA polymerase sigma factor [Carboxylicivirga sp. N1Y90]|uniref:RNA polymerase sigma factor n=1 Tax=Carboxylicivirga fragile TaxID=3417571 RepID=UPI003D359ADA|nr:sigma-70 family RNA polymerase sigma factor [Marinilabiliaceae bacterium N1Y90]